MLLLELIDSFMQRNICSSYFINFYSIKYEMVYVCVHACYFSFSRAQHASDAHCSYQVPISSKRDRYRLMLVSLDSRSMKGGIARAHDGLSSA